MTKTSYAPKILGFQNASKILQSQCDPFRGKVRHGGIIKHLRALHGGVRPGRERIEKLLDLL